MPQGLLHTPTEPHFLSRRQASIARVMGTPNRNFVCIIFMCLLIYLILYVYVLPSNVVVDEQYAHGVNSNLVENKEGHKSSVIAKECSKQTGTCYQIIDRKEDVEGGEYVERHMVVEGFEEDSDTVVKLIPLPGKNFGNSDTRMWKVDHSVVQTQYIAALIAAPFIVSTFSLVDQDNHGKSMLEIGLGGGSLDMFIHQKNPKINITAIELDATVVSLSQKFFNVVEDETRKTIVDDGLKFIDKMAKENLQYDAIFLDACDSSNRIPCPGAIFRKLETYKKLSEGLKENGVLVVNILSYEDNDTKESKKIIDGLTKYFQTCMRVTLRDEINIIAICTRQAIQQTSENVAFLKLRASTVTLHLGLQDVLTVHFV